MPVKLMRLTGIVSDLIKRRVKQDKEEHVLEHLETITYQG